MRHSTNYRLIVTLVDVLSGTDIGGETSTKYLDLVAVRCAMCIVRFGIDEAVLNSSA